MPLLVAILVACILAGLAVWLLQQFVSDPTIVKIGRAVVVVALVLWLLSAVFGMPAWGHLDWGRRY